MIIDYDTISDVEFENIDHSDYPDYVDAYIAECTINGRPATDAELDEINNDRDFVYASVIARLF